MKHTRGERQTARRRFGTRIVPRVLPFAALSGLPALVLPSVAHAQTPSPLAEWQYSPGIVLEQLFLPKMPTFQAVVGVATSLEPLYDGAGRYQVQPGPVVDLRYKNLAFASVGEGLGVNVFTGKHYRIGVALTYDLGRRVADDRDHLQGLGNIEPAAEAKLFAEYVISKSFPLVLRVDARRQLGGADGWIGDAGAYLPLPGSSETFQWFAGPTVTVADATYMQNYFGVGQAQSFRSGYPRYKAHAGIKSYGFGVTAIYFFTKHWFATADAAVAQLVGSAANSPITQASTEGTVDISFNYMF